MKKNSIIKKIDYLFLFTILFFICFIVLSYFITRRFLCFLISFVVAYCLYTGITYVTARRNKKLLATKNDIKNIQSIKTYLITIGTENAKIYLNKVFNGTYNKNIIETNDKVIYVNLSKPCLTLYDVSDILSSLTSISKEKYILAERLNDELIAFLSTLEYKISLISYKDLYFDYIKDKVPLPQSIYKQKKPTKNTFASLIRLALSKKNAKGYFVNGIIIFLFSFLYQYRGYYLLFSLGLFILALVSYLEPFKNTTYN